MRTAVILALAAAAPLAAQITLYSEFQRVDPFGKVVAVDRAGRPREILSPAIPRNAWTSFHIAVEVRDSHPVFLFTQQNPEQLKVTLYKERFVKTAAGWIPDALEKVAKNPATARLPEPDNPIPGQNTVVYWMDIWTPPNVPAGRMRLEVLVKSGDRWTICPPGTAHHAGDGAALVRRARAGARDYGAHRCGAARPAAPPFVRRARRRPAGAPHRARSPAPQRATGPRPSVRSETGFRARRLRSGGGMQEAPAPEWWLKVRYALLQAASTR